MRTLTTTDEVFTAISTPPSRLASSVLGAEEIGGVFDVSSYITAQLESVGCITTSTALKAVEKEVREASRLQLQ